MSEQKKQCNCKGAKRIAEVTNYLKQYGDYADVEQTKGTKYKRWLVNLLTIILIPFLFMYILINVSYNAIVGKGSIVSMNRIYKYIQDKNNG